MIDAHIHLQGSELHPMTLEEGDRLGVQLFVGSSLGAFQYFPTYEEVQAANNDMRSAIRKYTGRVAGYCYVNPRHGERALTDFQKRLHRPEAVGCDLVRRSARLSIH
jgi:predicted TIM-barrel fold metal-dependent hydrolase